MDKENAGIEWNPAWTRDDLAAVRKLEEEAAQRMDQFRREQARSGGPMRNFIQIVSGRLV